MNYQGLQYKYTKNKKKNCSSCKEKYLITKGFFDASSWKDYKDYLKEQRLKEELQEMAQNRSKSQGCTSTKVKGRKRLRTSGNSLRTKELYREWLNHPLWKKKRLKVLERDHHQCVLCGSDFNLQVHHTRYHNDKKAWEYPMTTLVTLCGECHKKVHSDPSHRLYPVFE